MSLQLTNPPYSLGGAAGPSRARQPSLVWHPQCPPRTVDQYRRLAHAIRLTRKAPQGSALAITSALPEEGKTLTTVNLGALLAETYGDRVLIIEADLRRPSIMSVLGVPEAGGGLGDWLLEPAESAWPTVTLSPRLSLVPAGPSNGDPVALLSSRRFAALLESARATFDWVIVDTPPVALLCDAAVLGDSLNGFLLVVAAGRTPYPAIRQAVAALGRERVLGVVFNRAKDIGRDHAKYAEYYRPIAFGRTGPG